MLLLMGMMTKHALLLTLFMLLLVVMAGPVFTKAGRGVGNSMVVTTSSILEDSTTFQDCLDG